MEHIGNLTITKENAKQYSKVTEVTGDLSIHSGAKLDAPALTSVGGALYINSGAKLDALTSVGGALYIHSGAKLDALTSVGGALYINSGAKLDAPALTSVGGDLYINSGAKLDALTSVGGYLSIYSAAKLDANNLYNKGFNNFKVIDGMPCVVMTTKKMSNGISILSCRSSKIKNNKIVGDKFYVAQRNRYNAHGKTIQEAVSELMFKTEKRDNSKYRGMKLTTKKTTEEWALIYRSITGACRFGTDSFLSSKKFKKQYTLAEVLKETEGQWGHDSFKEGVK